MAADHAARTLHHPDPRSRIGCRIYYAEWIETLAPTPSAFAAQPPGPAPAGPAAAASVNGAAAPGGPELPALHAALDDWFEASARELPWRAAECTPWGVLVSEVMLQQTPVVRVLPV